MESETCAQFESMICFKDSCTKLVAYFKTSARDHSNSAHAKKCIFLYKPGFLLKEFMVARFRLTPNIPAVQSLAQLNNNTHTNNSDLTDPELHK